MSSSNQVRIGFIGCGGIANWHFGHMEQIDAANVGAVCDLIDERVQKAAERFQATPYKDYHEMLARETLDALYICVPPYCHDGMELAAIEKGCPIFVEKPVSLDLEYARKVEAALADANLISAVGFQIRYVDFWPRVKVWLEVQEVGMFSHHRLGGMPWVWWWRQRKLSGGQVVEQTIHDFDLLRYLFGEVAAVQAMGRRGLMEDIEDYDTEDGSCTTLQFENGVIGTVLTGCFANHGGMHGLNVFAKDGRLECGFARYKIMEPNMTIEGKAGNDYGLEEDLTFVEAVRTADGSDIRSPYADAVKSLEVVLAANRSMETGGELVRLR